MPLVSQAELARELGKSRAAISKLVKSGRISTKPNGKIDLETALLEYKQTASVGREQSAVNGGGRATAIPDDDEAPMMGGAARIISQYNKAKAAEKTYQAKLRQLEYEEKKELLIQREVVEDDAAVAASELRSRLFSIPARAAVICEGKSAREIERIIDDEIQQALEELQARFLTQGD